MILQPRKRNFSSLALGTALLLLLVFFCALRMYSLSSAPAFSVALGEKDGIALHQGAPELQGNMVLFSRDQLLQGFLMEVSPAHPLPGDFSAPNVYHVRTMVGSYLPALEGVTLSREAVYALCSIQLEYPLEQGAELTCGTLSRAQQEDWRREAFDRYAKVYPLNEALSRAYSAVPGGGESEHQLGYALDITLTAPLFLGQRDPLLRNDTGKWLAENMWRYGWLYRNAPDSSTACGCEGIHLRYVGKVHAAAMHALEINLEDYLVLLRAAGTLTIYRDSVPWAYLYCFPCDGSLSVPIPEKIQYQISADNTGYAILALAANGNF